MNVKTLFSTEDDRAVSPVIGVILMVAITVILAAVIGAFVLDLGQGQEGNVNAAVSYDNSTGVATLTDMGNADGVKFEGASSTGGPLESVGATSNDLRGNNQVQVVAYQGDSSSPDNSNVVQTLKTGSTSP
ncbi:type IV pilin [Halostella litorea]|uniref:type IV pilin n=1 Tax=Halostella litorea TaxID=2528831 RepID=UPI001091C566|nr:type IV pilin N-terminal domain-containing protein [Halostella litorea]